MNIIVCYHCFFVRGDPPDISPAALGIVQEQMALLKSCGLEDAATEIYCGVNGGDESSAFSEILPKTSTVVYHGLQCRNENRTIQLIEERVKKLDGEAYVCYFHAKGSQFPVGDDFRTRWRRRMNHHVIENWSKCVKALDAGAEACGIHYLTPEQYPGLVGHPYFGGNYFWAKASFLKTLPSITESPAVKVHGMDAFEARYESESHIGQGPRRPRIFDFHPGWPS